jgi:hypothetical protein
MVDGSLPHGELDIVDPELTQLGYLPMIDTRDTCDMWQRPSQYWLDH